jgi:hypothetical protein
MSSRSTNDAYRIVIDSSDGILPIVMSLMVIIYDLNMFIVFKVFKKSR